MIEKVIYNNLKFISQFYFQKIIMNSGIFLLEIYNFLNQLENNLYKKVKSEFSNKIKNTNFYCLADPINTFL